jgi:GR25 family glycosyltransferase involved in LPS biosynthesis
MISHTKMIQKKQSTDYVNYIISLKYPKKLLKTLSDKHNLNPILSNGIDGKKCSDDTIKRHFTTFYRFFGPKSSIGCSLSHVNVWKTFLKTDKKYAIIFEDDIILDDITYNLAEVIPFYVEQTPKDFDVLYLGSLGSDNTPNFFTISMSLLNMSAEYKDINDYVKQPNVALATHAYVISKSGAEKLVKNLDGNIHNHIDYCIQHLYSKRILNNYITKPRLLYQSSTDSNVSNNVSNTHPIIINKILSNFYVDDHVRSSYITTLSVFRIGSFNITISSLILIAAVVLYITISGQRNYNTLILFLILLSLPDIFLNYSSI